VARLCSPEFSGLPVPCSLVCALLGGRDIKRLGMIIMSKQKRKDIKYKDPEARDRIIANLKRGKKLQIRKKTDKAKKQDLTLFD